MYSRRFSPDAHVDHFANDVINLEVDKSASRHFPFAWTDHQAICIIKWRGQKYCLRDISYTDCIFELTKDRFYSITRQSGRCPEVQIISDYYETRKQRYLLKADQPIQFAYVGT